MSHTPKAKTWIGPRPDFVGASLDLIAQEFVRSHASIWNMPSDFDFLWVLREQNRSDDDLEALKKRYCELAKP